MVYPGSIPLDTDLLQTEQNVMVAIGYLMQAFVGQNTVLVGLSCTPTAPASMSVNVGPGAIVTPSVVEATAFGSIAANSTDPLVKMGINTVSNKFTLTAPSVAGTSQNYLIEAAFSEVDDSPATLTYFNSLNPQQALAGPNNSGTPQNTRRAQTVNLQLKVGSPANTGTQVTPPVDTGWVGLAVITVSYQQTSITSSSITQYPNSPVLASHLSSHHGGVPGQAPKINLASEVTGQLPIGNLPGNVLLGPLPSLRVRLLANTNFYVSTAGNDSTGSGTSGSPWATIQKALYYIQDNIDLNGYNATIVLATPGVYASFLASQPFCGRGLVTILGNTASPYSYVITGTSNHAVFATVNTFIGLSGVQLQTTGVGNCIYAADGATVQIVTNISFGVCAGSHAYAVSGGRILQQGISKTISGSALAHLVAVEGGLNYEQNCSVALSGTPAFGLAYAQAFSLGFISPTGSTFTGSATGPRYSATAGGVINTGGAGVNYLPGDTAGSTSSGGQYV